MIENEIKVIYMNLEEQIKEDIHSYLIKNELTIFGGYRVTVYGNIENNNIFYRYEINAPNLLHFFSEWFREDFMTYLKPFTTKDFLDSSELVNDLFINDYNEDDFKMMV
jgi:hypothetical protein